MQFYRRNKKKKQFRVTSISKRGKDFGEDQDTVLQELSAKEKSLKFSYTAFLLVELLRAPRKHNEVNKKEQKINWIQKIQRNKKKKE